MDNKKERSCRAKGEEKNSLSRAGKTVNEMELLTAYAEGNVSESERKAARQYLTDNPDQLETMMRIMDEDYDIQLDDRPDNPPPRN